MAMAMAKRSSGVAAAIARRAFASLSVGSDILSSAPGVSLQKARSWDEGVSSKFSTTPLSEIFRDKKVVIFGLPGAYTGVCSKAHVPSYKNNIDKFKEKGVDSVICVAVNDPYVMNGWAENLEAKDAIEFYGDFDGSFHKSLELSIDLCSALLGHRSQRWSAYVVDGKVQVLNVEKVPSEFKVSGGEVILGTSRTAEEPLRKSLLQLRHDTITSRLGTRETALHHVSGTMLEAVVQNLTTHLGLSEVTSLVLRFQNLTTHPGLSESTSFEWHRGQLV